MKCESCKIEVIEVEIPRNEGLENGIWDSRHEEAPYQLCKACLNRLHSLALRPLEYFNLVAIHGHSFHLHDDFYDYETGEAYQARIAIEDVETFKFPEYQKIKNDVVKLIDYSVVQFYTEDEVIQQLKQFDKSEVLEICKSKVKYNRAINYKAYEVAAKVTETYAANWIREEWKSRKADELHLFAEAMSFAFEVEEGFFLISQELINRDDKFLSNNISALLYFKSQKSLDWIESIKDRISILSSKWGHLAASSQFDWKRAHKWLDEGRPLSLISLDALNFCTTVGKRLNQSIWMMKLDPKLINNPGVEIITSRLNKYLELDNVPRTRNRIHSIIENINATE